MSTFVVVSFGFHCLYCLTQSPYCLCYTCLSLHCRFSQSICCLPFHCLSCLTQSVHCLSCLTRCSLSFLSHAVFTVFPVPLSIHCLSCLRVFTDFPVSFRAFTVSLRVFTVFPVSLSVHCLSCFSCLSLSLLLCNHKFYLYCVCLCVKSSKHSTV